MSEPTLTELGKGRTKKKKAQQKDRLQRLESFKRLLRVKRVEN
jgi:hypothetical protein